VLINSALVKWIFLPDFYTVPNSKNLIGQFVFFFIINLFSLDINHKCASEGFTSNILCPGGLTSELERLQKKTRARSPAPLVLVDVSLGRDI